MSRPESQAIGGFFPTPPRIVPMIARLVSVTDRKSSMAIMDPCAGDGAAVLALAAELTDDPSLYVIELERKRSASLKNNIQSSHRYGSARQSHCDAFRVAFSGNGASVLYLNPPYDQDRQFGRLEHRFLSRFTAALRTGGTLFFVVPFYALAASAELLARAYDRIECFRFPDPEWDAFKQVVLVARRGPGLDAPLESLRTKVLGWASNAESIHVLPHDARGSLWSLPHDEHYYNAFYTWNEQPIDVSSLVADTQAWCSTDRGGRRVPIGGILPAPSGDLLARFYPSAMPPRPAHIAAGIAAGVFNGARVTPNDPASGLPDLLVKGAFDKEYRTVEEKLDKNGETSGLVQVQQPKLVVTVLDLSTSQYHTLKMDSVAGGATSVAEMTVGDLLQHYGRSMLDTLLAHCPVLHDPTNVRHWLPLPFAMKGEIAPLDNFVRKTIPRELFRAQGHCVMGAVKLLGGLDVGRAKRRGKSAIVLGEIGSGKSSVALATAHSINARRVLIICPPHLLDSWRDQIAAVTPWAKVMVLSDVADVELFAADASFEMMIAVLSRETAKLGHAVLAVSGSCPGCGAELPSGDLAKKRSVCEATTLRPVNRMATWLTRFARVLARECPGDSRVQSLLLERHARAFAKSRKGIQGAIGNSPRLTGLIWQLVKMTGYGDEKFLRGLLLVLAGAANAELTAAVAKHLYIGSQFDLTNYGYGNKIRNAVRELLAFLPHTLRVSTVAELDAFKLKESTYSYFSGPSDSFRLDVEEDRIGSTVVSNGGVVLHDDLALGSAQHFLSALGFLATHARWNRSEECGTHLYQSVPEPRRVALATYISRRHPRLFDLFICDEGHEYSTDGSAQERAAHRLMSLGMPCLLLTGSIMNGYAESLFANLWALSPAFRAEFARDERSKFVDRYGYKKRLVEMRDKDTRKPVTYGAVTDRVEENARDIGQAPGVLPLLILKHLLPIAVTMHKTDLALDLPPCREIVEVVEAIGEHGARHAEMMGALITAIKADRFSKELAGKLWGQMSEAPSQLDRATVDTGNAEGGAFEVAYPESVGGKVVSRVEGLADTMILPKEQWMLDKVRAELAEGRNVMVFSWHRELLPRLARLITLHLNEKVAVLDPAKVGTAKREAWINKEVVTKNRRVMVTNPVAVRTGLNPLVHFATEVFMENPACDPITMRQAVGRVDRIGQTKETRIFFPVYGTKAQVGLHKLLMLKVAVSMSTDGLDAESALAAAGANEGTAYAGMSVGKQLYELLEGR